MDYDPNVNSAAHATVFGAMMVCFVSFLVWLGLR